MTSPRLRVAWWRWLCVLLLVCAAPVRLAGEYRTRDVESLRITIDSDWASHTTPGYLPVRFDITNLGESRVVEIVGYGSRYLRFGHGGQPGSMSVRYPLRLARGDRVRLTLPVPIFADHENIRFELREDGRVLERFGYATLLSKVPAANASALIVADPSTALGRVATGLSRRATTTSGGRGMGVRGSTGAVVAGTIGGSGSSTLDVVLEPSRLPSTWLGFTSLRAVFIGPAEWKQLREDQKSAVLTWAACGGDLVFVDGTFDALVPSPHAVTGVTKGPALRGYYFGRVHLPTLDSLSGAGLGGFLTSAEKSQDSNWALPANRAVDWGQIAARGFRLPIPGVEGVPARMYLAILLVFTMLIGPVNYWFLQRKGRQVLLVLTAPVISAIFILVLAGYVLAGEGIGVRVRAVSFTMLDEARRQAATRASVSLYAAGMSPSGGLSFARDVAIFPIGRDGQGTRDALILDLSQQQRFASGLIQARAPTNFEQIAFRPARERLAVHRDSTGITVVNGLGTMVRHLLYRDGAEVYSLAHPLAAGERSALTTGMPAGTSIVPTDLPLSARLLYLVEHQPAGSYLAVLERSPFWDPGVSGVDERGSFHLVLGWPGGQP